MEELKSFRCSNQVIVLARHFVQFLEYLEKGQPTGVFKKKIATNRLQNIKKIAVLQRQCSVSQVDENHGKNIRFAVRIASVLVVFARFESQRLLSVLSPQTKK